MGKATGARFVDDRNISAKSAEAAMQKLLPYMERGASGERFAVEMIIGPEEAEFLLGNNPDNRNLRPVKVAQFAKDIRHGRWESNGESIIVAQTGELNDGQHRLAAVLQTKVPTKMLVAFGYPRETRHSVDVGAARTPGDHLAMQGLPYAIQSAACARLLLSFEQHNGHTIGRTGSITSLEVQERVIEDELLREAVIYCDRHRIPFARSSVVAFVFYVLAKIDPMGAKEYIDGVLTGLELSAGDPAYIIRDRLMRGDKMTALETIEILFRGWNFYATGKTAKTVPIMKNLPVLRVPKKAKTTDLLSLQTDEECMDEDENIVPYAIPA